MTASIRLHIGIVIAVILYQQVPEKSRLFLPFCQFQDFLHLIADGAIILPPVGTQAPGAVLDAIADITEAAPAPVAQSVQRAVAEQAAEALRVSPLVTGEVLAFLILKKIVMTHESSPPRFQSFLLIKEVFL